MSAPAVIKDRYGDTAEVETLNARIFLTLTDTSDDTRDNHVSLDLTPKRARKLANALKRHADAADA